MNNLSTLQTELDSQLGYSEQIRLTPEKRLGAINQALVIVYGLLSNSSLIKATSTLTLTASTSPVTDGYDAYCSPPADFNEGRVLFVGDASTFENSDEVYEFNAQDFARLDSGDVDCFTQKYNAGTGELQFLFKGTSAGTLYIEYEKGAPTLTTGGNFDGLPAKSRFATAKLAAGILTDNLLADSAKMQIMLYGPAGNPSRFTPDSVYGLLADLVRGKRIRPQSGRISRVLLIDRHRRNFYRLHG